MPFCPISNDVLKPSTTVIRILIGCLPCSGPLLPQTASCLPAPTPFATTALATSVDIIRLNDAADGLLVIGLFHGLQQLVLEHPGGVILLVAGDRQSQSTGAVSVYQLCAARIGESGQPGKAGSAATVECGAGADFKKWCNTTKASRSI